eukprot:TRINITY_DN725_c0_g2_i1.p1 TRINITY_DN725_c0_g2~~TRINITY_DN725_c0_g2_i1.p1  ORF type:complete len:351 (-),score=83.32 TRINITY_DN725_c0_g2_i1:33-1031(-)
MFAEEERQAILENRKLYEIDYYYDHIKDYTFETEFVAFSLEEAKVWRDYNRGAALDDESEALMMGLKERIDECIQSFAARGKTVFIRLSSRSPKDAVDKDLSIVVPLLKEEMAKFDVLGDQEKMMALRRAFFRVMEVKNVDDALRLIMYSSRTISDMKRAIDYSDAVEWGMQFIVREFVNLPIEYELRGFVYQNQLTALTQYYCDSTFPCLEENENTLVTLIQQFYEEVKDLIPVDDYIIDFVWIPEEGIKIVELNPYSQTTGPGLFDWRKDKHILENGPFEFRYIKDTLDENFLKANLLPWSHIFKAAEKTEQPTKPTNQPQEEKPNCTTM